jgi:hypothetical protein
LIEISDHFEFDKQHFVVAVAVVAAAVVVVEMDEFDKQYQLLMMNEFVVV